MIKIQREDWPCGKEMTDGIPVELSFGAQKDAQEFLDADVAGLFEQVKTPKGHSATKCAFVAKQKGPFKPLLTPFKPLLTPFR